MTEPKEKPVCPYCSSIDIVGAGYVIWNVHLQEWDCTYCSDDFVCNHCMEEFKYPNWVEVLIDETE